MAEKDLGKWKCITCDESEGVINGVCPNCGPTQTLPIDAQSEKIAKVAEAAEEKRLEEERVAQAKLRNEERKKTRTKKG